MIFFLTQLMMMGSCCSIATDNKSGTILLNKDLTNRVNPVQIMSSSQLPNILALNQEEVTSDRERECLAVVQSCFDQKEIERAKHFNNKIKPEKSTEEDRTISSTDSLAPKFLSSEELDLAVTNTNGCDSGPTKRLPPVNSWIHSKNRPSSGHVCLPPIDRPPIVITETEEMPTRSILKVSKSDPTLVGWTWPLGRIKSAEHILETATESALNFFIPSRRSGQRLRTLKKVYNWWDDDDSSTSSHGTRPKTPQKSEVDLEDPFYYPPISSGRRLSVRFQMDMHTPIEELIHTHKSLSPFFKPKDRSTLSSTEMKSKEVPTTFTQEILEIREAEQKELKALDLNHTPHIDHLKKWKRASMIFNAMSKFNKMYNSVEEEDGIKTGRSMSDPEVLARVRDRMHTLELDGPALNQQET